MPFLKKNNGQICKSENSNGISNKKIQNNITFLKIICFWMKSLSLKGNLLFWVYNSKKPDKYGVKLYMLAVSKSGNVFDFEVYAGIGKTTPESIMTLMNEV